MKIETAFCVELNRSVTIHEAAQVFFTKPKDQRNRWTFYCDSDECRTYRHNPGVLIKAVGYDHRPDHLDQGQFAFDEHVRKITPYFAVKDLNAHDENCGYKIGRMSVLHIETEDTNTRAANRRKESSWLNDIKFSYEAKQQTSTKSNSDKSDISQTEKNVALMRHARQQSPTTVVNGKGQQQSGVMTVAVRFWDQMPPNERATRQLKTSKITWGEFFLPLNRYETGIERIYYFLGKVIEWPTGWAVVCQNTERPENLHRFELWVARSNEGALNPASRTCLKAAKNDLIRCFFVGEVKKGQTQSGAAFWGPEIFDWSNHVCLSPLLTVGNDIL